AIRAGVTLHGVLVERVLALGKARIPVRMIQRRRLAHASGMAGGAEVVEDHLAVQRAAIGTAGHRRRRGSGRSGRLGGSARGTGVHRTNRCNALFKALGRRGRDLGGNDALQVESEDDQTDRDDGQNGDHDGKALEKLEVVIPHVSTPLASSRWTMAAGEYRPAYAI